MLQKSLQNTLVLYLRINFQLQTHLVFQNYEKTVVIINVMKIFHMTLKVLVTRIPFQETIDYIQQRIHVLKEIKTFCKKSIFKKLLLKLTKECIFSENNRLVKQINGCPMGGPISSIFRYLFL